MMFHWTVVAVFLFAIMDVQSDAKPSFLLIETAERENGNIDYDGYGTDPSFGGYASTEEAPDSGKTTSPTPGDGESTRLAPVDGFAATEKAPVDSESTPSVSSDGFAATEEAPVDVEPTPPALGDGYAATEEAPVDSESTPPASSDGFAATEEAPIDGEPTSPALGDGFTATKEVPVDGEFTTSTPGDGFSAIEEAPVDGESTPPAPGHGFATTEKAPVDGEPTPPAPSNGFAATEEVPVDGEPTPSTPGDGFTATKEAPVDLESTPPAPSDGFAATEEAPINSESTLPVPSDGFASTEEALVDGEPTPPAPGNGFAATEEAPVHGESTPPAKDESCTDYLDCYNNGKMCDPPMTDAECICKNKRCKLSSRCGTSDVLGLVPCSRCNDHAEDCDDKGACIFNDGKCLPMGNESGTEGKGEIEENVPTKAPGNKSGTEGEEENEENAPTKAPENESGTEGGKESEKNVPTKAPGNEGGPVFEEDLPAPAPGCESMPCAPRVCQSDPTGPDYESTSSAPSGESTTSDYEFCFSGGMRSSCQCGQHPQAEGCFERADYWGNDLNLGSGNATACNRDKRNSAKECQALCSTRNGCNYFTWNRTNSQCTLKSCVCIKHYTDECGMSSGAKSCNDPFPNVGASMPGRPFIVQGKSRTTSSQMSSSGNGEHGEHAESWKMGDVPSVLSSNPYNHEIGRYWLKNAEGEHASVASFARHTLQLMSIGAPSRLLIASQEASLDEIKHAKMCYGFASAFIGSDLGPGSLDVHGSLESIDLNDIVRSLIIEGCIGETLSAMEAHLAAHNAQDSAVKAAVSEIASDETKHAQLAWDTIKWIIEKYPDSRTFVEEIFQVELAQQMMPVRNDSSLLPVTLCEDAKDTSFRRYGLLVSEDREKVREAGIRNIIEPNYRAGFKGVNMISKHIKELDVVSR